MGELVDFNRYKLIDLDKLVPADWNYKSDDPELARKLCENIRRNGQIENIIVRKIKDGFFEVVNGNHRLQAFKELGLRKVIAYDLGEVSIKQAKRISIETNELKFKTDSLKLAENIKDILSEFSIDDILETMPFSRYEIEGMEKLFEFDWDSYAKKLDADENLNVKFVKLEVPEETNYISFLKDLKRFLQNYPQVKIR